MNLTGYHGPSGFELLRDALDSLRVLETILTDAQGDAIDDITATINRHDIYLGDFDSLTGEIRAQINDIDYYFNH
ncbi:hypothetical protein [Microbacterium sp.]|uniref:hypothetical protein n=1 Tax=Microbacterium sp. TaxID=51671 RepID=UPI003C78A7B9